MLSADTARSGYRARYAEIGFLDMTRALAVLRTAVGLVFVAAGAIVVTHHQGSTADFLAWHVPVPALATWVIGAAEVVCGALFALGALTRPVGLLLATIMVGATLTAGRYAGGLHVVAPPILFALCVFYAWRSARRGGPAPLRPPGVQ